MKTLEEFKQMARDGRSIKAKLHLSIMNALVNEKDHKYVIFRCPNDQHVTLARLLLTKYGYNFDEYFDPFREDTKSFYIFLD